jgi:hypothetical protein
VAQEHAFDHGVHDLLVVGEVLGDFEVEDQVAVGRPFVGSGNR